MGPVEAFKKLGYETGNNYDWTVLNDNGLCLALWGGEISWTRETTPVFDTRCDSGLMDWRKDPKHEKRLSHLQHAWDRLRGRVHVVIRDGMPDDNPGTAQAWLRQGTYWALRETPNFETRDFCVRLRRDGETEE